MSHLTKTKKKLFSPTIQLEGHQNEIYTGKFSNKGEFFASGGNDKVINIWKVFDRRCRNANSILNAHSNSILELCWSDNDDHVISCSVDKRVTVWDIYGGSFVSKFKDHDNFIYSVDSKKNLICSVGEDCCLILNDIRSKEKINSYMHKYQLTCCKFSYEGSQIFFGGIDNQVWKYDLRMGKVDSNFALIEHTDTISGISLSHDDKYLLSNSMDNSMCVWELSNGGGLVKKLGGGSHGQERDFLRCAWSFNDKYVSCGSSDKIVHIWDVNKGLIVKDLYGHSGAVNEVDFNAYDSKIISSVSSDHTAIIGYYE